MAQANVGRLFIDLEARTARIEADLNKANQKLDQQTKRMKRTAERNMKAMTNVITGLVGLGIGRLIVGTINAADQIAKLSVRLGDSTEALSQYRLVAEKTGVEFRTLTTGMQRMTRRISEAAKTGKGEAVPALQELGLSAKALADLKPHEQFELLSDAMMEIPNQGDRVRLAMKLFDTEGVALLQTMEGGSAAIRELREQADQLGLTLSEDTAKQAEEFNDRLTDMKARMTGLVQEFIPIANKIIEGWTLIAGAISGTADQIARFSRLTGLLDSSKTQRIADLKKEIASIQDDIAEIRYAESLNPFLDFILGTGPHERRLKALQAELEELTRDLEDVGEEGGKLPPKLDDIKDDLHEVTVTAQRLGPTVISLMRSSASATELFNAASAELDQHFENLGRRAQHVMDRLDPLAKLTRDYEDDVAALADRFGDDEEGLAGALEKLNAEYEENKKRIEQSTGAMREQESWARKLANSLLNVGETLNTINSVAGFGSSGLTSAIRQGSSLSFLPPEFQIIGNVVADAVDFIRGIFGGGGINDSEIVFGAGAQGQGGSPLIFPGIGNQRTLIRGGGSEFRDEFQGPAAQAADAFFTAFAAAATPEQIEAAQQALEGRTFIVRPEDVEGGRFLTPVFNAILSSMEPVIQGFVRQFDEIGERLEAFAAINITMQALDADPVQAFADAMAMASETTLDTLNRLGDELRDLGAESFSSIEAMQRLGVSVQQYNQFVFQTLANIENARRSIGATTSGTIDALRFQTLDEGGQFTFLTRRAEELAGGLGDLTDPNQIAARVAQINQLTQQAFNIASPAQQQLLLNQFIPFLESVQSEAEARLEAIRAEVEQRAADDRAALQAIFAQGQVSADTNVIAAETSFQAAQEFKSGVDSFGSTIGAIDLITREIAG